MPRYMCTQKCYRKMPDGRTNRLYQRHAIEDFKNDKEAGNHFVRLDSPKEIMTKRRLEVISKMENEIVFLEKVKSPDAPTRKKLKELKGRLDSLAGKKKTKAEKEAEKKATEDAEEKDEEEGTEKDDE